MIFILLSALFKSCQVKFCVSIIVKWISSLDFKHSTCLRGFLKMYFTSVSGSSTAHHHTHTRNLSKCYARRTEKFQFQSCYIIYWGRYLTDLLKKSVNFFFLSFFNPTAFQIPQTQGGGGVTHRYSSQRGLHRSPFVPPAVYDNDEADAGCIQTENREIASLTYWKWDSLKQSILKDKISTCRYASKTDLNILDFL